MTGTLGVWYPVTARGGDRSGVGWRGTSSSSPPSSPPPWLSVATVLSRARHAERFRLEPGLNQEHMAMTAISRRRNQSMSLLPASRAHRKVRSALLPPLRVLCLQTQCATLPRRLSWLLPMEPCIETYFHHVGAGHLLSTMLRSLVALAVVIIVPQHCPAYRGVHAKGFPVSAQTLEPSSTTTLPCGQTPACLQVRKDRLQSTLVDSGNTAGRGEMLSLPAEATIC